MSNRWEVFLLELKAMTTVILISFREQLKVLVSKQDTLWEQIRTKSYSSGLDVNKSIYMYHQNYWRHRKDYRRKHRWNPPFKENKLFVKTLQVFIQDILNALIICKLQFLTRNVTHIIVYRQRPVVTWQGDGELTSPPPPSYLEVQSLTRYRAGLHHQTDQLTCCFTYCLDENGQRKGGRMERALCGVCAWGVCVWGVYVYVSVWLPSFLCSESAVGLCHLI